MFLIIGSLPVYSKYIISALKIIAGQCSLTVVTAFVIAEKPLLPN